MALMRVVLAVTAICKLMITVGVILGPAETENDLHRLILCKLKSPADDISSSSSGRRLSIITSPTDLASASVDFGLMPRRPTSAPPIAVLRPTSSADVAAVVRISYESHAGQEFPVSARGHGHSINGQAEASGGVVVEMTWRRHRQHPTNGPDDDGEDGLMAKTRVNVEERYVDVWGGEMWVDVLESTLPYGLAPRSWTDYLYLTVGGTLSNAGISGQAFNHGPQISNVYQLEVVTGKGEVVTCSEKENEELFYAVLGGLGQFGIITRARIALEPAPHRTRWIRVVYSDFTAFTRDQEWLISLQGNRKFDYVEGFVIADEGLINNWRSSFFSPVNPVTISSLSGNDVLYCLEVARNYFDSDSGDHVDQEVGALLEKLDFIPGTVFTTDVTYVEFLDRVHRGEMKLRSKGLWEVPHPWLNLFIPRSRIADFDRGVFRGILGHKKTSGPILVYPINKNRWDNRTSVATPDEDVFYAVSMLRSALDDNNGGHESQKLEYLLDQNRLVLDFCKEQGIDAKQYLPHYTTQTDWANHFGPKWNRFYRLKMQYDPKQILATGQRIFGGGVDRARLGSAAAYPPTGLAWL